MRSILDDRPVRDVHDAAIAHLSATRAGELEARCHPLGFVDVPLFEDDAVAVKLHIWHPRLGRPQVPQPLCHSHGWSLRSTVLCGTIENHTFPVRAAPGGRHRLYGVVHVRPFSISLATDTCVDVGPPVTATIGAAASYRVPAGVFHATMPRSGATVITAVVADLGHRSSGALALARDAATRHAYRRRLCSPSERELLREAVLGHLA